MLNMMAFSLTYLTSIPATKSILPVFYCILNSSPQIAHSVFVCVCCPLNEDSKGILNKDRLNLMKDDAILVGATWDVVVLGDLISVLKNNRIRGAGFDVAIEGGKIDLPEELLKLGNVVLTPHIGYNTVEAKIRQVDICISNIEAFNNYPQCYEVLGGMVKLRCRKICKDGGGPPFCKIRKCCQKKGINGCWECEEFETCEKLDFLKPGHGDAHIKNLRKINKQGIEEFLKGRKYWYAKPK